MSSRATGVMRFLTVALLGLLITACDPAPEENNVENAVSNSDRSGSGPVRSELADVVFYGGDILTMVGEAPEYVESLAVGA